MDRISLDYTALYFSGMILELYHVSTGERFLAYYAWGKAP